MDHFIEKPKAEVFEGFIPKVMEELPTTGQGMLETVDVQELAKED